MIHIMDFNMNIQSINISENRITKEGIREFRDAIIIENKRFNLRDLDLSSNLIDVS
jgi:hypothetical protein